MIVILVLLMILIALVIYFYMYKRDRYRKFLPFYDQSSAVGFHTVITPLVRLRAEIKNYKTSNVTYDIFIYDPAYMCSVRDQGDCGACWAFVVSSLISDGVTIRINKFGKNLSVEELLTCYPHSNGCEGAVPENVLLWLAQSEFEMSISDDYVPENVTGICDKTYNEGISVAAGSVISLCTYVEEAEIYSEETKKLIQQNIHNMKASIQSNGPIFSTIAIYSDFFEYKGEGIYRKTTNDFAGGHAIEIIGWCNEGVDIRPRFHDGYWVCKNSWGYEWAPEFLFPGHFAILMGNNECGIESRAGTAEPNVKFLSPDEKISSHLVIESRGKLLYHKRGDLKDWF